MKGTLQIINEMVADQVIANLWRVFHRKDRMRKICTSAGKESGEYSIAVRTKLESGLRSRR